MAKIEIKSKATVRHTNIGELRNAIEVVVKMLANKGIKVTQRGIQAYVEYDEKTLEPVRVNIPSISDKSPPELVAAIKGFVDHEVAHILFTDPKMIERAHKEKIANLHNIVEDTFIEAKMKKAFPGSTRNIDQTVEFAVKRFFQKSFDNLIDDYRSDENASQAMFFVNALATPAIRALAGQEAAQDFMADKWELIPEVYAALLPLSKKISTISSSFESLKMANTIRDLLAEVERDHKEKKEEPKEEDEDDGEGDESECGSPSRSAKGKDESNPGDEIFDKEKPEESDDDGEDDSEAGGSGDKDEDEKESDDKGEDEESPESEDEPDREGDMIDESGADSPEEKDDDAGVSKGKKGGSTSDKTTGDKRERHADVEGGSGGVHHNGGISDHPELAEAMEKMETYDSALGSEISKGAMSSLEAQSYMPYSSENDRIEHYKIKPGSSIDHRSRDRQENLRLKIGSQIGVMSKALERLLMARNRSMFVPGFKSGRLHSSSLFKLNTGDTRVFRRKEVVRTKNTAVLLLVDCSGSMNYRDRIVKASDAAYALCSSLDRVGVKTQVVGFTTAEDIFSDDAREDLRKVIAKKPDFAGGYDRIEPLVMPIYKKFDERLTPDCEQRLAAIPFLELRNNADGECVEIAANMLRGRTEERKILVVLSDGEPAMRSICVGKRSGNRAEDHLRNVIKDTEESGIEVLGIGIETHAVDSFYPKNIVLDDVSELPSKIVSELSAMLLR